MNTCDSNYNFLRYIADVFKEILINATATVCRIAEIVTINNDRDDRNQ